MISFFLTSVNKTWPNQRTELWNLATPATGIKAVAYHCCHIHDSPKRQADVIIIEQHEYSIQNETLADLIGHVRAQFGTHAALVFIHSMFSRLCIRGLEHTRHTRHKYNVWNEGFALILTCCAASIRLRCI